MAKNNVTFVVDNVTDNGNDNLAVSGHAVFSVDGVDYQWQVTASGTVTSLTHFVPPEGYDENGARLGSYVVAETGEPWNEAKDADKPREYKPDVEARSMTKTEAVAYCETLIQEAFLRMLTVAPQGSPNLLDSL